jgi:hypothetical protein
MKQRHRSLSTQFKFGTVTEALCGAKSIAEVCRERDITEIQGCTASGGIRSSNAPGLFDDQNEYCDFVRNDSAESAARYGTTAPFYEVSFECGLGRDCT